MNKLLHALLIVASAAALTGAAAANQLTMAATTQPETLDPQVTAATSSFQTAKSIYDTLVEVRRDGTIGPALASSWSASENGTAYTFELVEATFHDGTSLTAEDVVASLDRIRDPELGSPKTPEYESIEAVVAVAERTVRIELNRPTPALLATLASGWSAILPSEKLAAGHDFGNTPVGTGPFQLDTWVRDSHVRLVAFEDHFRGRPALDRVTIRFVEDTAVQLQGLLSGEFQVIDTVASADIPLVEEHPELVLSREPSGLVLVASINNRRDYLSDPRVRQALNYAVDKEIVLEAAYGGGTPVGTFMEAGSPWLPSDIEPYPYDPERARQLLSEAGVPSDWTLDMALPQPYEAHVQAGQIVQDMLRDVGVRAEIRMVEWGVWLSEVYGGPRNFDLTNIGHTGKLDPTGRLDGYGEASSSYVGYENEQVVAWLNEARRESDADRRAELYAEVLRAMHEEAPFLYIGTPFTIHAHHQDVQGFWITPLLDTFDFRSVTIQ